MAKFNDRGCGGSFSILVSQDSIAEFQTLTSNYSPDYGIGSGGQILMVLKSGAKNFDGGPWEFNRNEAFDANNYISKLNHQPTPKLRLNIFGGNIGGPLMLGTGVFPKPNVSTGAKQYVASVSQPTFVREDLVRIDHAINQKLQLVGNYIHDQNSQTKYPSLWSNDSYPTVGSLIVNPAWAAVVKLTQTITPNLLNETAFNYNGKKPRISSAGTFAAPSGFDISTFFTGNEIVSKPKQNWETPVMNG